MADGVIPILVVAVNSLIPEALTTSFQTEGRSMIHSAVTACIRSEKGLLTRAKKRRAQLSCSRSAIA